MMQVTPDYEIALIEESMELTKKFFEIKIKGIKLTQMEKDAFNARVAHVRAELRRCKEAGLVK